MNSDWFTYLSSQHKAFIKQDRVLYFDQPTPKSLQPISKPALIDLSHLGLINFSGEEAQPFLQGQLSCDVNVTDANQAVYGGYCTPKGRLLCSFLLWQATDHSYLMQLPVELVASVIKRLKMFVLRAKVTIQDQTNTCIRIGITGKNAHTLLQSTLTTTPSTEPLSVTTIPNGQVICHSENRFEMLIDTNQAIPLWKELGKQAQYTGAANWDRQEIQEGIPAIFQATQEQFIPQMVNLDIIGGVGFRKGCYPGQEIVARTQYLGKVKRRMYRAHLADASLNVTAGDNLFSADTGNQVCGTIVNAAPSLTDGIDVLAVIQTSSADAETPIYWKALNGPPLSIQSLPYQLSMDHQ
jgi:folate-binding protein YgfZ